MDSRILTTLFQIVWLLLCLSSVIWNSSMVVLQYILPPELQTFFFYDAGLAFGAFLCLCPGDMHLYAPPVALGCVVDACAGPPMRPGSSVRV